MLIESWPARVWHPVLFIQASALNVYNNVQCVKSVMYEVRKIDSYELVKHRLVVCVYFLFADK